MDGSQAHNVLVTPRWPSASFLGRLATTTCRNLSALGTPHRYHARQTIIRQGAEDDHALLLLSGSVKITYIDESGYEALLAVRVGGDLIGEMAPLQEQPRSATVTTCCELRVRILSRSQLVRFLKTHPDAAIETTKMVMSRLQWANHELQRRGFVVWHYGGALVTDMRRLCEFSGLSPENP